MATLKDISAVIWCIFDLAQNRTINILSSSNLADQSAAFESLTLSYVLIRSGNAWMPARARSTTPVSYTILISALGDGKALTGSHLLETLRHPHPSLAAAVLLLHMKTNTRRESSAYARKMLGSSCVMSVWSCQTQQYAPTTELIVVSD